MGDDIYFMTRALELAQHAASINEVPVGAVLVLDNKIISEGFNCPISTNDPTAHAEIIALRRASEKLNNYRLLNTTLYVTLEPCLMCMGAMTHARVQRLVFGANDLRESPNHKIDSRGGVLEAECAQLLRGFFQTRR